jgi:hypothetical protein
VSATRARAVLDWTPTSGLAGVAAAGRSPAAFLKRRPWERRQLAALVAALVGVIGAAAQAATAAQPAFPLLAWEQRPDTVDASLALGVNTFMGADGDLGALAAAIAGRASLLAPLGAGAELPGLAGYYQPDEPDATGLSPDQLLDPSLAAGLPVYLTVTAHFASDQEPLSPQVGKELYPAYFAKASVVGFDLYPLSHYCYANRWGIGFDDVFDDQRELAAENPGKATFQWIELNALEGVCGPAPISPPQLTAEIWLAIAGGARGLGYFTWAPLGDGTWTPYSVLPGLAPEAARQSARIRRLGPTLLAPQLSFDRILVRSGSPVKVGGRASGGAVWLLAVNSSGRTVTTAIGVRGAGDGRVRVDGENRTVPLRRGAFSDRFGPYAVHVYRLEPARS